MPPCVLLGGLNVTRALGLSGIPVIVASTDPAEAAFSSRFCIRPVRLPPLSRPGEALAALVALAHELQRETGQRLPLACANDDYLRFVYDHREVIEREFLVLLNEPGIAEAMLDKERFALLARERDLPVPASYAWEDLPAARGPVMVKPRSKLHWSDSALQHECFADAAKGAVFASGTEALATPWVRRNHAALMFQEFIPGTDHELWCFDGAVGREGTFLAGYAGRKLRTFPAVAGESSFVELRHNRALEELAREIAGRLGLRGIFNMDFKRHAETGRYSLLEINARHNQWLYPAARSGMPLCRVLHDELARRPHNAWRAAHGRYRWLAFDLDRCAYRELSARGSLSFMPWAWSLIRHRKVYNLFSWSDPLPFIHFQRRRAHRLLATRIAPRRLRKYPP